MKDNRWLHIEFESGSITREDFRRFREYEAATSRTYRVEVTTIVVCFSTVNLVPLLLTPLMSGEMWEKERSRQGFFWLNQEYPEVNKEDLSKMQTVF